MMQELSLGLLWYLVFAFSVVVHEASHAFVSMKLGDSTAYEGGQVTLDPIPHIRREPVGMVIVPALSFITSGWMLGWASAPYDPEWARAHPKRSALMALAGPLSNLLLCLLAAVAIRVGMALDLFLAPDWVDFTHITAAQQDGAWAGIAVLLSIVFSLNLVLCIFNLLPIPPLDGSGVLPLFLSRERAVSYMDFIQHPHFALVGLIIAWQVCDPVLDRVHLACINLLYPGLGYH